MTILLLTKKLLLFLLTFLFCIRQTEQPPYLVYLFIIYFE